MPQKWIDLPKTGFVGKNQIFLPKKYSIFCKKLDFSAKQLDFSAQNWIFLTPKLDFLPNSWISVTQSWMFLPFCQQLDFCAKNWNFLPKIGFSNPKLDFCRFTAKKLTQTLAQPLTLFSLPTDRMLRKLRCSFN
eukprot:UN01469